MLHETGLLDHYQFLNARQVVFPSAFIFLIILIMLMMINTSTLPAKGAFSVTKEKHVYT